MFLDDETKISITPEAVPESATPFYSGKRALNLRMQRMRQWSRIKVLLAAALAFAAGFWWNHPTVPTVKSVESSVGEPAWFKTGAAKPRTMGVEFSEGELVPLKGGIYEMGDALDGLKDAQLHQVQVSPFQIGKHEVTLAFWERVMSWGLDHGYTDLCPAMSKGENHPVYGVSWDDAVKWCNALSEMEMRIPCYYTDADRKLVLRTAAVDIHNEHVRWDADGYRLPTEAEWEMAARGALAGKRFPWGDEISHQDANYSGATDLPYDKSQRAGPAAELASSLPYTAPTGSFSPNSFGLHDMAGNVAEWCWDFYDMHHGSPSAAVFGVLKDPRGPDTGMTRVVRGGSWRHQASEARCASRFDLPGMAPSPHTGFRVVRR
ncbi:MAG TPA: hypothetical protein DDZ88_22265 [Verrucomicrobiales bacterium]|nr:hypothetical protein [Verrucomicrobiales bacterium]